jgi:hypothetical protein
MHTSDGYCAKLILGKIDKHIPSCIFYIWFDTYCTVQNRCKYGSKEYGYSQQLLNLPCCQFAEIHELMQTVIVSLCVCTVYSESAFYKV